MVDSVKSSSNRPGVGAILAVVVMFVVSATVLSTPLQAAPVIVVYSDGFDNGWRNPGPGGGVYVAQRRGPLVLDFGGYNYAKVTHEPMRSSRMVRFRLRVKSGLDPATQRWYLAVEHEADRNRPHRGNFTLDFSAARQDKDGYYQFSFDLGDGNLAGLPIDALLFQAGTLAGPGLASGTIGEINDIEFFGSSLPIKPFARIGVSAKPARESRDVMLDCGAVRPAISPRIYGIAMYKDIRSTRSAELSTIGATGRRWGGNRTTRYNADLAASNTANDYFFQNTPDPISLDDFVRAASQAGQGLAVTVPAIGWIAKDASSFSYPVTSFGEGQTAGGVDPDHPEKTNGAIAGLSPPQFIATSPEATSIRNDPSRATAFVERAKGVAESSGGRVDHYIIDNEPDLWVDTHRDVRRSGDDPGFVTYEELVEVTKTYAAAIRAGDPAARIAGPAISGYNFLLFSPRDVIAGDAADFRAHGSVELLRWYLQQLKTVEGAQPGSVIDVVDVHHYPAQQDSVGRLYPEGNLDKATFAARIEATRGLWDATYTDDNYIGKGALGEAYRYPAVLPRIQSWIAEVHGSPDALGLSVGEWSFGQEDHMSGAIATAEALGIFGRQRLDSAYYWTVPPENSPAYWAFRAYTNFDGNGSKFAKHLVPTNSSIDPKSSVSVFASSDGDTSISSNELVAVVINKSADTKVATTLSFGGCAMSKFQTYTYNGASDKGFVAAPSKRVSDDRAKVTLDPWSITVVKFTK